MQKIFALAAAITLSLSATSAFAASEACKVFVIEGGEVVRQENKLTSSAEACASFTSGFTQRSQADLNKALNEALGRAEKGGASIEALEKSLKDAGTKRRYPLGCWGRVRFNPLKVVGQEGFWRELGCD